MNIEDKVKDKPVKLGNLMNYHRHICCPICTNYCGGNSFLHQLGFTSFMRDEEDCEKGLKLTIMAKYQSERIIKIEHDMTDNPSGRRNGIMIYFGCENCSNIYALMIEQHKGTEYVSWKYISRWDEYLVEGEEMDKLEKEAEIKYGELLNHE